jgi:hypothetical protein
MELACDEQKTTRHGPKQSPHLRVLVDELRKGVVGVRAREILQFVAVYDNVARSSSSVGQANPWGEPKALWVCKNECGGMYVSS